MERHGRKEVALRCLLVYALIVTVLLERKMYTRHRQASSRWAYLYPYFYEMFIYQLRQSFFPLSPLSILLVRAQS